MRTVLVNPCSGNGYGKQAGEAVAAYLREKGVPFELVATAYAGHATLLAQEAAHKGHVQVLAVGGDGTAGEAAQGLCGTGTSLAVIPAGTGNDFAKTLALPRDLRQTVDVALMESRRRADVLRVNDRICLNISSVGIDAMAAYHVQRFKRLGGKAAYCAGLAIAFIRYAPLDVSIELDGAPASHAHLTIAVFANGQYYGGGFHPVPTADPFDGKMDVLLVDGRPRRSLLPLLKTYSRGQHMGLPICRHVQCSHLRLISHGKALPLNIDGEILCEPVYDIRLMPGQLWLNTPHANEEVVPLDHSHSALDYAAGAGL